MASRTNALIDGISRKNYYESSGKTNLAYWDDPSYHHTAKNLRSNTDAYTDDALDKNLVDPKIDGTPFLNHSEITRIVSRQFAQDIKERSRASTSMSHVSFALVFLASGLTFLGMMNTLIVVLVKVLNRDSSLNCMQIGSNKILQKLGGDNGAFWIWVTAGFWASLTPFLLGMLMECSKRSSPADYIHTFDPQLRLDGSGYNNNKSDKTTMILIINSLVFLVLGFICGVIDLAMSYQCLSDSRAIIKFVAPIGVCIVCIIVFILVLLILITIKKQDQKNSNYDRRDYDININYGQYDPRSYTTNRIESVPTVVSPTIVPAPAPQLLPQPQHSVPLVTIIQPPPPPPVMPVVPPFPPFIPMIPPPPSFQPPMPPIFANASGLPVRAAPYRRPMYYQLPYFNA